MQSQAAEGVVARLRDETGSLQRRAWRSLALFGVSDRIVAAAGDGLVRLQRWLAPTVASHGRPAQMLA